MKLYYDKKHDTVKIELYANTDEAFFCSDFATVTAPLLEFYRETQDSGVLDAFEGAERSAKIGVEIKTGDVWSHKGGGVYHITRIEDGREDGQTLIWYRLLNRAPTTAKEEEWCRVQSHFLESFGFLSRGEHIVEVKLKSFEQITALSDVFPVFVDNIHYELALVSKEKKPTPEGRGSFWARFLLPYCGEWIRVGNKGAYEFEHTYCFYAPGGSKCPIGEWMIEETRQAGAEL